MAKIPYVQLSSTINTQRLAINRLIDSVGDLALLTTTAKSTIVGSVNEVDARLDSINSTQLTTPLVFTTDLIVTDSARIANNLSIGGDITIGGDFNVAGDFVVTGTAVYSTPFILFQDSSVTASGGIAVYRGLGNDSAVLQWNESADYWVAGTIGALSKILLASDVGIGLKVSGDVVSIDSAEIVNYASPIRALFAGGNGLTVTNGTLDVGAGVGIKVGADDVSIDSAEIVNYALPIRALFSGGDAIKISSGVVSIDSAEIVNYASPIRALFSGGDAIKISSGVVSIDSAEIVNYALPIRALFSGDSNVNVNTTTGAITLDTTISIDNLNADSATFTGVVNALDFNSTSDIKFKENVTTLENSINTLNNIRPVSFNWIGGDKSYGVIAQELENILPELVTEDKYGIKRVSYTPIIALLIDAIKAHEAEIQKLKNCQCGCK